MILAAILFFGILTMWIPARWALTAFEVALFGLAAWAIARRLRDGRAIGVHPVAVLLGIAAAWGVVQIVAHRAVYQPKTWEAVLGWMVNACAFSLALDETRSVERRERFLRAVLIFAIVLSVVSAFTVLTSPAGFVFWKFDVNTGHPTLGPFVYRNQWAAFVEAVLPLAIVRALLDRKRSIAYMAMAGIMFASVIAGGSRTGSILCLSEIVVTPVIVYASRLISGRTLFRGLAGGLAAIAVLTAVVGWETIWNRLQEQNPYAVRADLLQSSMEMVRDRPVMGFGLGTWSTAYPAYARYDDGLFVNQAHNDWVQWAAEGGIPFFAIMLAIVAMSVRPAVRSLWGIGMLAVFVHCLIDYPMQQRPALAAFFFALLGAMLGAARE